MQRVALVGLLGFILCSLPSAARGGERGTITLALGGDVMLGRLVDAAIRADGPARIWGDVLPLLRESDVAIVNLECVIAAGGEPFLPHRVFYFRAAPGAVEALRVAGIDAVNLANNHALDFGAAGILETIEHLDRARIAHAGAGRDLGAAAALAFVDRSELRVGLVGFADHFEEYAAGPRRAGTNVIPIDVRGEGLERARAAIRAARRGGADLVVFSIHWGPNMREAPTPPFVEFARAVIDAGADVFHGHSAHLFHGIEIHHGKPILYDTGDLIDDYRVDPELRNDRQLLFLITASARGPERLEMVPLRIERMQVNRARGEDLEWIHDRIRALSRPFGTELRRSGDRLSVVVR